MSRRVTAGFLVYFALGLLPILGGAIHPGFFRVAAAYDFGLLLALVIDFAWLPGRAQVRVSRVVAKSSRLGRPIESCLTVESRARGRCRLRITDEWPEALEPGTNCWEEAVSGAARIEFRTRGVAGARGDFSLGPVTVRAEGPLGLAVRQWTIEERSALRVYPELAMSDARAIHVSQALLREAGLRSSAIAGQGRDFDHLRAYVAGDEFRVIDWKATARRDRLMSRQHQSERNQQVMLVIDAGRRMTARTGRMTRLDHAIQAALQLAHIGLLRGDQVGLQVFADAVRVLLPPARGRRQLHRIARSLVHVQPEPCEPDYDVAFNTLQRKCRRRTLVIVFTEVLDSESSRTLLQRVSRLVPRHLPLCVSIADPDVTRTMLKPVLAPGDVYDKAVARELHRDTRATLRALETCGTTVIHVPADRLTASVLRKYLDVKERGML